MKQEKQICVPVNLIRVLEAIEELCAESDNERFLMEGKFTNGEISLANTISNIYKIAHSHAGHCGNSHEDWRLKI